VFNLRQLENRVPEAWRILYDLVVPVDRQPYLLHLHALSQKLSLSVMWEPRKAPRLSV
jgi:hypothetical protein